MLIIGIAYVESDFPNARTKIYVVGVNGDLKQIMPAYLHYLRYVQGIRKTSNRLIKDKDEAHSQETDRSSSKRDRFASPT